MKRFKLLAVALTLALAAPALAEDAPGTVKIPGTNTTLKLNGFVEVDMTYDFNGAIEDLRGTEWASFLPSQPLDDSYATENQPNRIYMTARTSRIGLTTTTPTGLGNLVVRVEGDFNHPAAYNFSSEATTNGMDFRLRHGYGELGGLLIGQTWSNFMDGGSFPDTVDFNGHGAFVANRVPMIRYALPVGKGSLSFSLENPQSVVIGTDIDSGNNESLTVGRRYDRVPAGTASFTLPLAFGHVNVRGVAMEYQSDDGAGNQDSKIGWGAGISGSIKFASENLVWSFQGGDGIGMYDWGALFQGAGLVGQNIKTWTAYSYHVGLTHTWSPTLRSNAIWSQSFFQGDDELEALFGTGANETISALYVNTFVTPVKNFDLGLEFSYGQRKVFDSQIAAGADDTGTQQRVNALARFTFF